MGKICFNLNYFYIIVGLVLVYGIFHVLFNQKLELNKRTFNQEEYCNDSGCNDSGCNNNGCYDNQNIVSVRPDYRKLKSLDRVFNPLEYPFQSTPYYNNSWYPSYTQSPGTLECGRRREPCYGGSQTVIDNRYPSRCINNDNIAPVNIRTRGPEGEPQQVGTLFNLSPGNKDVLPLFGRRKYPNDDKWEYYTVIGKFGAKVPVKPLRNYQEIGTNDILQLVNYPGNFQATVYKREDLQYIPYI
jgi:hypothetical protein